MKLEGLGFLSVELDRRRLPREDNKGLPLVVEEGEGNAVLLQPEDEVEEANDSIDPLELEKEACRRVWDLGSVIRTEAK